MKIFILIMSDGDMRPRRDIVTTAAFTRYEDAKAAMESDISEAMVDDAEIERCGEDYAVSVNGRFLWKIETKMLHQHKDIAVNSARSCHA